MAGVGVGTVTVHIAALAVASFTVAWEDDRTSEAEGRMMVMMMADMVVDTVTAEACDRRERLTEVPLF